MPGSKNTKKSLQTLPLTSSTAYNRKRLLPQPDSDQYNCVRITRSMKSSPPRKRLRGIPAAVVTEISCKEQEEECTEDINSIRYAGKNPLLNHLVLKNIFNRLPQNEILKCRQVCQEWKSSCSSFYRSSRLISFENRDPGISRLVELMKTSPDRPCRNFKFLNVPYKLLQGWGFFQVLGPSVDSIVLKYTDSKINIGHLRKFIFEGVPNIKRLTLQLVQDVSVEPFLNPRDKQQHLPQLHSLVSLKIHLFSDISTEMLICLFKHSPNLEVLSLTDISSSDQVTQIVNAIVSVETLCLKLRRLSLLNRNMVVLPHQALETMISTGLCLTHLDLSNAYYPYSNLTITLFNNLLQSQKESLVSLNLPVFFKSDATLSYYCYFDALTVCPNVTKLVYQHSSYNRDGFVSLKSRFPNVTDLELTVVSKTALTTVWQLWPDIKKLKLSCPLDPINFHLTGAETPAEVVSLAKTDGKEVVGKCKTFDSYLPLQRHLQDLKNLEELEILSMSRMDDTTAAAIYYLKNLTKLKIRPCKISKTWSDKLIKELPLLREWDVGNNCRICRSAGLWVTHTHSCVREAVVNE